MKEPAHYLGKWETAWAGYLNAVAMQTGDSDLFKVLSDRFAYVAAVLFL
jgi:hypothetical protein